jgi:hypothetical protein
LSEGEIPEHVKFSPTHPTNKKNSSAQKSSLINVRGELVFSVMTAGWFCEMSGSIGKVEDVKPVLLKIKRISIGNHFEKEDFYLDEL